MKAGRKRAFDKTEALESATQVFWENGYSGTSLTDLTTALGINKPSLYAAFGNKEQLFAQALEHYLSDYRAPTLTSLTSPPEAPLRERLQGFLYAIIDVVANPETPKGCMFVKSCCESGSVAIPPTLSESLQEAGMSHEAALMEVLEAEQKKGQLTESTDISLIAGYLMSVMTGLSVQAGTGKPKEALRNIADRVVDTMPEIV